MAERRYGVPSTEEQRQLAEATEDIEEPATAARGRAAEDRAIPSTSTTTVEMQASLTAVPRAALTKAAPSTAVVKLRASLSGERSSVAAHRQAGRGPSAWRLRQPHRLGRVWCCGEWESGRERQKGE